MPALDYIGTDTFTFKTNDGVSDSNISTVTVTVTAGPEIASAPEATPAEPNVGDTVSFAGAATSPQAVITWNFGDGSPTAIGGAVSHVFQSAGVYTVTMTATLAGESTGSSIMISVNEFGANLAFGKLTLGKLLISLNFAKPETNTDTIHLDGKLPIPAGFVVAGQRVQVNIGGILRSFVLDATGASPNSEFKLTIKLTKGVVKKQTALFRAQLGRRQLQNPAQRRRPHRHLAAGQPGRRCPSRAEQHALRRIKKLKYTRTGTVGTTK